MTPLQTHLIEALNAAAILTQQGTLWYNMGHGASRARDSAMRESKWLTVRETAARLGKSDKTIRRWIKAGKYLPVTKIGSTYRFDEVDVEAFLAQRRREPGEL